MTGAAARRTWQPGASDVVVGETLGVAEVTAGAYTGTNIHVGK